MTASISVKFWEIKEDIGITGVVGVKLAGKHSNNGVPPSPSHASLSLGLGRVLCRWHNMQ